MAAGLTKGDKVATVLPNCLEQVEVYCAAAKTGLRGVPLSPLLQRRVVTLLGNSDAKLSHLHRGLRGHLDRARTQVPGVRPTAGCSSRGARPAIAAMRSWWRPRRRRTPDAGLTGADSYSIIYSSGTTGEPRASCTHAVRAGYCTLFASVFGCRRERLSPRGLHGLQWGFLDLMPWMFLGGTYILHPAFDAGCTAPGRSSARA